MYHDWFFGEKQRRKTTEDAENSEKRVEESHKVILESRGKMEVEISRKKRSRKMKRKGSEKRIDLERDHLRRINKLKEKERKQDKQIRREFLREDYFVENKSGRCSGNKDYILKVSEREIHLKKIFLSNKVSVRGRWKGGSSYLCIEVVYLEKKGER